MRAGTPKFDDGAAKLIIAGIRLGKSLETAARYCGGAERASRWLSRGRKSPETHRAEAAFATEVAEAEIEARSPVSGSMFNTLESSHGLCIQILQERNKRLERRIEALEQGMGGVVMAMSLAGVGPLDDAP